MTIFIPKVAPWTKEEIFAELNESAMDNGLELDQSKLTDDICQQFVDESYELLQSAISMDEDSYFDALTDLDVKYAQMLAAT